MLVGNAACWFSANDIMQACWSKKPKAIILHYGQYHAYPYCDFARNTTYNNRNLYLKDILNEPGQLFSSTCSSLLQAASSSGEQKLHRNGSGTCCIRSMIILFIVLNILSFFPYSWSEISYSITNPALMFVCLFILGNRFAYLTSQKLRHQKVTLIWNKISSDNLFWYMYMIRLL